MNASDIETAVAEFLGKTGVSFSVQLVGPTKRDEWECDEWRVRLKSERADYSTQYFTGTGHRVDTPATKLTRIELKNVNRNSIAWQNMLKGMKPKAPSPAAVLHSFVLDGGAIDQSFIDWCEEYGSDPDSRKALATYEACCESGRKLRQLFTREQREELAQLLQDY